MISEDILCSVMINELGSRGVTSEFKSRHSSCLVGKFYKYLLYIYRISKLNAAISFSPPNELADDILYKIYLTKEILIFIFIFCL